VNPLDSCYAKVRQAEGHAKTLHEEIRAFHKLGVIRIDGQPDPQSTDYVFRVKASEEPPLLDWGCRIGDVLHNLRSALDHLAWQLVVFHKGEQIAEQEARNIYFPAALAPNDFNSLAIVQMIDSAHLATLRGLQPYHRGDRKRAEGHPLVTLRELSNIDKHRIVHMSYVALREFPFSVRKARDYRVARVITQPDSTPLKDGQELARVEGEITGTEPEIEGHAKLTGHVAFSDGTPLQHKLDQLSRAVRHILDQFKSAL
jgi:hypothetical protein